MNANLACSSAATNITVNTANNSANANADVVLQTAPTPANANAQTAPDALVADLYKQHDADKSPFFQDKNRALVDKYFTKATADLIWKDSTTVKEEPGALNGDPLYDAQDMEIKNFKIGQAAVKNKSAAVPVTFENFGEKKKITFSLVQENGTWKIEDIRYQGGYTLVGMFKEDAAKNSGNKKETSSKGEFEGKYQVGDTTCTVKPIKMAFEVKWEKGTGIEIFFADEKDSDKWTFSTELKDGDKINVFSFDDENYTKGTFYRADGKEFAVKRIK